MNEIENLKCLIDNKKLHNQCLEHICFIQNLNSCCNETSQAITLTHEPFLFILGDVGGQGQANS